MTKKEWVELNSDQRGCCTSNDCCGQPTWRLEADGIGSDYCSDCKKSIEQIGKSDHFGPARGLATNLRGGDDPSGAAHD